MFYIRRKWWNLENFQRAVFDVFTRVGMFGTGFHYFYKMPVCDTNFVAESTQKLMDGITWNAIISCIIT